MGVSLGEMTKPLEGDAIYLKRHFDTEIIVLCVRWYITQKLSYRDLAAMMAERADGRFAAKRRRSRNSFIAVIRSALSLHMRTAVLGASPMNKAAIAGRHVLRIS